jgi:tRNA-splicing ligase RtcB
MRQHLTAVQAAAQIGRAELSGAAIGSVELSFVPKACMAGEYKFAVGTAGSATLVLQTVLPALCLAEGPSSLSLEGGSSLSLEGGTHNPWSPPFDFLAKTYLPLLNRMGPKVTAELYSHGFYPAGGGAFKITIEPVKNLRPLEIVERGDIVNKRVRALVSKIPLHVGRREIKTVINGLNWNREWAQVEEIEDSPGPGNILFVELESKNICEVFSGFGKQGVKAEKVAADVVEEVRQYLAANVPVGSHLADQLMLPMALAGFGKFRTSSLSRHATTNIEVIRHFLKIEVSIEEVQDKVVELTIKRRSKSDRISDQARSPYFIERDQPAPWRQWGKDLEAIAVEQMENAVRLPISVRGALMPDAHLGYGLPIGGVLATQNAVIPYAVGVDIACRMRMSVFDIPLSELSDNRERFRNALERETRFGIGANFRQRHEHQVMDEDWSFSPVADRNKDKAWGQLGTSGSGNHFVEFGSLTLEKPDLGLEAGQYLAVLSHSGSRGTGNLVATHYSKVARSRHPELPKELSHLAWLDLDSDIGQEYFLAMQLMGRYAAANHELIHKFIAKNLGVEVMVDIENHHNFAWLEEHDGQQVVVHRKGATPAGEGVLGVIPGSMGTSGYVVRGKGRPESLNSASHGAGRLMSRKQAKKQFTWKDAKGLLESRGVTIISAGLDEVPMAYKDIEKVMNEQDDLVERVARFDPKLVKMAKGHERPED